MNNQKKHIYSISVIVPVYNEIKLLEKSISKIHTFISGNFKDYEIIIVESGSTDGSDKICNILTAQSSHIKIIHEGKRNGFGSALKIGYKTASKELVWSITVDLPFPVETIFKALPLFSEYDCVLSYRANTRKSIFRNFQSFVFNELVKKALRLKVKHVNSAFKVFK
ncbi:MAG TPA: glycosyltransferase family 2 protein, partial [Candidatus Eremiobacteraeota bacterium]|nr:glycosyltransferase family 2 protein [Candidatus Eremiobacteraeota bacterium]